MKNRHTRNTPDPLTLMVVVTVLGMMLSTTLNAQETFFDKPDLDDLMDGDITLARAAHSGAAVHMSFNSLAQARPENHAKQTTQPFAGTVPDIFLSLRLPW